MTETDRELFTLLHPFRDSLRRSSCWPWLLFALLQLFNLYQLLTHAMWRDELQTWSIVRESATLVDLFHNMRYEGFPPLWFLTLWGISRLSTAPLAMQLLHFTCSLVAQLLVFTRAPFSVSMRLAIVAGYYFSFEYCLISRAYGLGVLLLVLGCAFHTWLARHPLIRGGILGLVANTSVYGAMVSLVLVADDLRERSWAGKKPAAQTAPSRSGMVGFLATYGALFAVAVACMIPPADGRFASDWNFNLDLDEKFYLWCKNLITLVPIPVPTVSFWNSLVLLDSGIWVAIPAAVAVMVAIWFALRDSPRYLMVFAAGFIAIWLFAAMKYIGLLRHNGTAAVLLVVCLWLARHARPSASQDVSPAADLAVWCLLGANLLAWGIASYYHLRHDFSGSRAMATILQHSDYKTLPIVADVDYAASAVAGYLGRPLHYASNNSAQMFIRWSDARTEGGPEAVIRLANALAQRSKKGVLLLLNYPWEYGPAKFLAQTDHAIVPDEVFYLYEYRNQ